MGLLKTAAKAAVASSVHGRVQRRQQQRWAAQEQAAAAAAPPAPPAPQMPPSAAAVGHQLELLAQLAQLHGAGVLTDTEFEAKKAAILAAG